MKLILSLFVLAMTFACNCTKKAQKSNDTVTSSETNSNEDNSVVVQPMSPIGVFFTSMASGPADDAFLKEWVTSYISKNNIKTLSADRYSGCGKEGEYVVLLNLDNEVPAKVLDFRAALELIVTNQVKKNKATDPSSGPINIEYGVKEDRYSYCRLGGKKWL